jgi:DNA-binding transcriptional regulator YdaS (Cro superfamily)
MATMNLADLFSSERGAQSHLAAVANIPAPMLSQWASGARPIPIERCAQIERATGGKVTVQELRPDLHWVRVKDKGWPHPDGRPLLDAARASGVDAQAARA